jgi:uncharacterized protein with WD repeat
MMKCVRCNPHLLTSAETGSFDPSRKLLFFFPQQHIHNPNQKIKEIKARKKKKVKDILKGNSIPPIKVFKSLVDIEVSQWTSQTLLCDYLMFFKVTSFVNKGRVNT